jgi:hypothetical protein
MKKILIVLFLVPIFKSSFSQNKDSSSSKLNFELSFGQSLLFINNSKQIDLHKEQSIVIPTNAVLFFAEFRSHKKLRIPVFLNLPTESKQFLVNGVLINERASPTFGAGLEFQLFKIKLDDESSVDFEIGPLASFIFDLKNNMRIAPIIAGRLRILRGEHFVMYVGGSYSVGINTFGLIYGTGTKF